jgi:hypothetical protein
MYGVIPPSYPPYAFMAHIETTLQLASKQNHTYKYYVPGFTTVGLLLDAVVWWLGRGLGLYEETNIRRVRTCSKDDYFKQLKR